MYRVLENCVAKRVGVCLVALCEDAFFHVLASFWRHDVSGAPNPNVMEPFTFLPKFLKQCPPNGASVPGGIFSNEDERFLGVVWLAVDAVLWIRRTALG